MTSRPRVLLVFTATTVLLAGCGIPADRAARPITQMPTLTTASPGAAASSPTAGTVRETLYLVKDGQLVAVERQVGRPAGVETLTADLQAGPDDIESQAGYTSALLGTDQIAGVRRDGTTATVDLTAGTTQQVRTDQILGFGQIVCTLTSLPGVQAVAFTSGRQPLSVPRADGSLSDGPLTAGDYAALLRTPLSS